MAKYLNGDGLSHLMSLIKNDTDAIYSRGEQLVVNGSGFMGDNTNWSSWEFDGSVANKSKGSFTRSPAFTAPTLDDFIPVDPSKSYAIEFDVKCGTDANLPAGAKMYAFLNYYDVDGLQIGYYHGVYHRAATTTTLTQDLNDGDTVVHFADLTNWWTGTTASHQRSFIFWDYTNSFGYTYPANTYSRHEAHEVYAGNDSVDKTNNTITLSSAWNKGTVPAGTKVSQNASGGNYDYIWNHITQATFPTEWKHVKAIRHPVSMWKGVATVKIGFLWNYGWTASAKQQQIWITNTSMREIDPECETLGFGNALQYGSDLNDIVEIGEYYLSDNANVASIANKPTGLTVAFKLVVKYPLSYRNYNYVVQEITEHNVGRKWYRLTTNGGSSWGNWVNCGGFGSVAFVNTVPIANGGTGKTTAKDAANVLIGSLDAVSSSNAEDTTDFITSAVGGGTTTFYRRNATFVWNWIKGKISSVLGLTSSQYGGNAATATTAGNVTGTVAIAHGGTGATTAANARANLGLAQIGYCDGYIKTQPENSSPVLIPFINNDIAHLLKRGGSAVVTYDGVVKDVNISNAFDGSPSYWQITSTDIGEIVFELTLHKVFTYKSLLYIDFGPWYTKTVKVEVKREDSSYANDVWTEKYSTTTNTSSYIIVECTHTPVGASNSGGGFNKIRLTFSFANGAYSSTQFRIAQIGLLNFGSQGLRETYMSRGVDDRVFRDISPYTNNTYNLGASSYRWANVYANTFYGSLNGNATNVTGTVAIANGGTGATTAAAAWTALGGGAIGKKASLAASDIPSHASSATTYGAGSSSNYGHVKLSDSTSASTDTTGGTAATPKAVKAAYDLANGASTTAGQALSAATGALAFKVTYSVSGSDVVCAAHVYSAGSEVTNDHNDSCFVWSMSLDGGATWTSLGTGKTKTVSAMSTYGGNVKCDFTPAS